MISLTSTSIYIYFYLYFIFFIFYITIFIFLFINIFKKITPVSFILTRFYSLKLSINCSLNLNHLYTLKLYNQSFEIFNFKRLIYLTYKNYIFKIKNITYLWKLYVDDEIETFITEILHSSIYLFILYEKLSYNSNIYMYLSKYYYSWEQTILTLANFYYYYKIFKNINFTTFSNVLQNYTYTNKLFSLNSLVFKKYLNIFFSFFKTTIVSIIIVFIFFIYLVNFFYINLFKQLAIWIMIGLLFFWLISGFNFFLKRGRFGKLTSALFRFWKRTNTYFWLVEGFLFLLFFYYYLNSSQEPLYMYDYSALNQTYLPNLYVIYCTTILLLFISIYYYYWTLNFSNFTFSQNIIHITIISLFLIYVYLIESYQFYYIITLFFENIWNFNYENNLWILEFESPRLRVKQQYMVLALIAKYWHFIFIFLSWIFFIMKVFEQKRAYYTHSGFNLQNLIILFWLNFLFILQWFKWIFRRFYDSIYFWFFTDTNFQFIKFLYTELLLLIICDVWHKNVYFVY